MNRIAMLTMVAGLAASASAQNTWTGAGDGTSWDDAANWSDGIIPNNAATDVVIDDNPGGSAAVLLTTGRTIASLRIDAGDSLTLDQGAGLTFNGDLTNDGSFFLNASNATIASLNISFTGARLITGNGELVFNDDPNNQIISNSALLTQAAGHTIRGAGRILANSGGFENNGTVIAEGLSDLTLDPGSGFAFTNNGVLRAAGPGGLTFNAGNYDNNATIDVFDGSRLTVAGGARIIGGTIATTGSGFVNSLNGAAYDAVTVAAGSNVLQAQSQTANISNGLTNNGTWRLDSVNATIALTQLAFAGDQTLGGTGQIVLSDDPNNTIAASNATVTQDTGHTIRGAGLILNNSGGLINNGTIIAEGDNTLTLNPGSGAAVTNNGVMRASGPGGLRLNDGLHINNSTIEVADASTLAVAANAAVQGGTLLTTGSGVVDLLGGSRLRDLTIAGGSTVQQRQSQNATADGDIVNNGTWNLLAIDNTIAATVLDFDNDRLITGNGQIVLSDDPNNLIRSTDATLTNGADHTIRGSGTLLVNSGGVANNGAVIAQGDAGLIIDPGAGFAFTNNGTLRAEGAGGLTLNSGQFNNATSIDVADGSRLRIATAAILSGGTLTTAGTGVINPLSGATLDGVTFADGSVVDQAQSQNITVINGLTNNGQWQINSNNGTIANTIVDFTDDQTLGGTGEMILSDDPNNLLRASNAILTQGAGHTISGAGQILANSGSLINDGNIIARGGNQLVLDPGSGGDAVTNNGNIRAEGTGGILLNSGQHINNADMHAADGSNIRVGTAAVVTGGTLSSSGTGQIQPLAGSTFDAVTISDGTSVVQNQSQNSAVINGLTNNGQWLINSNNSTIAATILDFNGSQTIDGTGTLVLTDDPNNLVRASNATLTNGVNHTISGAGTILNNSGGLNNLGTILATGVSNDLRIDHGAGSSFTNNGTIGGNGTITLADGGFTNDGRIAPGLSTGTLTINGDVENTATAIFDIEIAGASDFDLLNVIGEIDLDGTIELTVLGAFEPDAADAFTVLTANSVLGNFSNAVADAGTNTAFGVMTNGFIFDVTYNADSVVISNVVVPTPGAVALLATGGLLTLSRRRRA